MGEVSHGKTDNFRPLHHSLDSSKNPKSAVFFLHFAQNSSSYSSANTLSKSSIKNSIYKQYHAEEHWGKKPLFFSLHQNHDRPILPKTLSLISFLDFQTDPHLSPTTACCISSVRVSIKLFCLRKMSRWEYCWLCFLHWNTDSSVFQTIAIKLFHFHMETQFPVNKGLVFSISVSVWNLKLV